MVKTITANASVREEVYEWATRGGQSNADLLTAQLLEWAYALVTNPVFKHLAIPDQTKDDGLARTLGHIQQMVGEQLRDSIRSVNAALTRAAEVHASDQVKLMSLERASAEEAVRTQRTLRDQVEKLQHELEKERTNAAWMNRQANAKGIRGEASLYNVVATKFPSVEVQFVGNNGMSEGDFHVQVSREEHFISIESKCTKYVDAEQVAKSVGHARSLKKKHGDKHLGHLFVSMEHVNIPGKGSLNVDLDSVPGATLVWLGLPQLEGNEDLVAMAFGVIWQNAALHRHVQAHGGPQAHKEFFGRVKEAVKRMAPDMEMLTNVARDCAENQKINERLQSNLRYFLRKRLQEYTDMCGIVSLNPEIVVTGKDTEALLRGMLGKDCTSGLKTGSAAASSRSKLTQSAEALTGTSDSLEDIPDDLLKNVNVKVRGGGRPRKASTMQRVDGMLSSQF